VRPLLILLALLPAWCCAGCVEVEERLAFEREGNGTYRLEVRWDANLLTNVRAQIGEKALAAFAGTPFPLDAASWRDGLAGLAGVRVVRLEEGVGDAGWKSIALEVAFERLEHLLAWELLAARTTFEVAGPDDAGRARITFKPFEHLPVLDPLREAALALAEPPPPRPPELDPRDLPPWERLGLEPAAVEQLRRLLSPALERVRLVSEVAPAGRVERAGDHSVSPSPERARFLWAWTDLLAGADRTVDLTYKPGEFDKVPVRRPAPAPR
jgi:hypothetical protein